MMQPTIKRLPLVLASACLLAACAHAPRPEAPTAAQKRPFPTLEEYSAGASRLTLAAAAAFKAKDAAGFDRLLAATVALKPAGLAAGAPFESPSGLRVERFTTSAAPIVGPQAKSIFMDRRERFQGVVLSNVEITGIEGAGERRTLRVHSFFAGMESDGSRRQDESWWRWEVRGTAPVPVAPSGDAAAGGASTKPPTPSESAPSSAWSWTVETMIEERRTIVTAPRPLLQEIYPTGGSGDWVSDSDRDSEFNSTPIPGDHDTGGVAAINDCVDGGACLLVASGMTMGALSRGRVSDEGAFEDRAEILGLGGNLGEVKAILPADFNNDTIPDLFVTYDRAPCRFYKGTRLLEEVGEPRTRVEHLRFSEDTDSAGLGGIVGPFRGAIALDADRDGRLDLYVVQFGDTTKTGPSADGNNGQPNRFFRNITEPGGKIRFSDETASSGTGNTGWGLSASAADFDGDGRTDIYVVNNFGRNSLFRNITELRGPIRFEDVGRKTGTDESASGAGAAWGDYDGDGQIDLLVTNYWFDQSWILAQPGFPASAEVRRALRRRTSGNSLFRNEWASKGRFVRVSEKAGVLNAGWPWGAAFADIDGDGRLDIVVANGILFGTGGRSREIDYLNELGAGWADYTKGDWKIDFGSDGITGPQPERLFINLGDGTFAEAAYASGLVTMADLRGLIAADINSDGAPDIVGASFLGSPVIFENMNSGSPSRVRVLLEGTVSNWDAVGAVVRFTAGGKTQTRQVIEGGSFLSASGRMLDFSLAGAQAIDRIEIVWPSGQKTVVEAPEPRRGQIVISEPAREAGKP